MGDLSAFEKLSLERKEGIKNGEIPEWYTTLSYITYLTNYQYKEETVRQSYQRIAKTLSKHYTPDPMLAYTKFFEMLWKGFLGPSTPVQSNTGTDRGLTVSCAGNYMEDSIPGMWGAHLENAVLSKLGFGTSSYIGDIRPRGANISSGGKAAGQADVFETALHVASKVTQGGNRRGKWAGYTDLDSPDFWEIAGFVRENPADSNIGYCYYDETIESLKKGDPETVRRWNEHMFTRCATGKGYFWKPDVANRLAPQAIKNSGVPIKASNLCNEISLPQNHEYTFTCVLSSLNLAKWDEFNEDTIYWGLIFLDCVTSEFIDGSEKHPELKKARKFAVDFRAVGLGVMGWHTYLQEKSIPFESFEAHMENNSIFSKIQKECKRASAHLAKEFGESKHCAGLGIRNATMTTIPPTMTSALLCGAVSQGIEPFVANAFNQATAAGEFARMNPTLTKLLKSKGEYSEELVEDLAINHSGSVQHLDCLTDHEKLVFKTAYEIDQTAILRLASVRQKHICQGQSLNLFFSADENEEYIASVHKKALLDDNIKGLYYFRSEKGVKASKGECIACE